MPQQWQGQSYNEKWEPVDAAGTATGARDQAAFKTATGGGRFDWGGWNTGAQSTSSGGGSGGTSPWAAPNVNAPTWGGATPVGQAPTAPSVAPAAPLSGFGSDVQGSIQRDLGPASVNQNDPAYVAQLDAFRRNEQRSADRLRAGAAQRANAQGTNFSGGFDSQMQRVLQNQGARESDFEAQLMGSELAAARDRTARAQQLGTGLLSQEQSQGLQQRLADQSALLQGQGFQQQRDLANQGIQQQTGLANQDANMRAQLANQQGALASRGQNWQETQGANDAILRRNALNLQSQLGLGDLGLRARGMSQQDEQYYAGLGQQLGLGQAQLNQQAMMALLGGG